MGKTTFATQMPGHLLIAAEAGYRALPGVIAQDVNSWGEMKQVARELKKPEVKEHFQSIIIDTVDLLSDMCQKYICQQLGIESMGEGGFANNSWVKYRKNLKKFSEQLRCWAMPLFLYHMKNVRKTQKLER